jgi:hypothetical protein
MWHRIRYGHKPIWSRWEYYKVARRGERHMAIVERRHCLFKQCQNPYQYRSF